MRIFKRDFGTQTVKNFRAVFDLLRLHLANHCDERVQLIQIKKFSSWYSAGYPNASNFRKRLFSAKDSEEVFKIVEDYFDSISEYAQEDTSKEAFLMGGHG